LSLAAIGLWIWSVPHVHPYAATITGLVSILPITWWVALALSVLALFWELARPDIRTVTVALSVITFVLILHGTLPASESTPRFDAAYAIAEFTNQLAHAGHPLPLLDARMSWPALFSAGGMASHVMGVQAQWFLRWTPFALNLCYLLPLKVIANGSLRTARAQWLALPLFLAGNWLDQDYFSPQGIDLFLYLTVIAILLRVFATRGEQPGIIKRVMGWRGYQGTTRTLRAMTLVGSDAEPGEVAAPALHRGVAVSLYVVVLLLVSAVVVSHQFTPIALGVVLIVLTAAGRTRLRSLWLLVAVLAFAWLSWQGRTYWVGHLGQIFGNVGQVGAVVSTSVVARLRAVPSGRLLVQHARIAASLVTWIGAGVAFWWSWRRGRTQWTLAILAVAPVVVALATNYGGEVALRILLFSLAPAAVLIAGLVDTAGIPRLALAVCAVIGLALLALFPLARYGNESFEAMAPSDLAAATWVTTHVPSGSDVLVDNSDVPFASTRLEQLHLTGLAPLENLTTVQLRRRLPQTVPHIWIFLDRSQSQYAVANDGARAGWEQQLVRRLIASGDVQVADRTSTAVVLRVIHHGAAAP
jgi:hypothetical protein